MCSLTLLSMKRESSIGSSAFLFLLDLVVLLQGWGSVDSLSLLAAGLPAFFLPFPLFFCGEKKISPSLLHLSLPLSNLLLLDLVLHSLQEELGVDAGFL